MSNSSTLQFKTVSLLAILLAACLVTSCTEDDPDMTTTPETFVYLINLNDEPDLQPLTIVDSLNGAGSMVIPDIPAHPSNTFDLIIDRVDDNRANISASQPETPSGIEVVGSGFFSTDSVYIEMTIEGFINRDILSGKR